MITQVIANNINPRISPDRIDEMIAWPKTEIFDHSWLNSLQTISSNLTRELKTISFFDLLEQTPTIRQLFSKDYLDLVDNLVNISENHLISSDNYERLMILENDKKILADQIGSITNTHELRLAEKAPLTEVTLGSVFSTQNQNDTNNYNHLYLQQNSTQLIQNQQSKAQPNNRQRYSTPETTAKPYEDKMRNKSSETLSRQLIKSTIKLLNNLAVKLGRFV